MYEREWSYQVGHGSCGLYVQSDLHSDRIEMSINPPPATGRMDPDRLQDASKGLKPLQEAEELNRGEKKVREVED